MNFVFAAASLPSDSDFDSKKARCEGRSVGEASAWSATGGKAAVGALFKVVRMPAAFEPRIWRERPMERGQAA